MQQHVLVIVPRGLHGKGGIERQMLRVQQALPDGSDVRFLDSRGDSPTPWWLGQFAVCCVKVLAQLAQKKIKVLHLNTAVKASLWRKLALFSLARAFGVPIVLHVHGGGMDEYLARSSPLLQRLTTRMFQKASSVLVLGEYWRTYAIEGLGCKPEKVQVLPNALADPFPGQPSAPARTNTTPHLLFLGEVGTRKGVDVLLNALAPLSALAWQLTLAGNGNLDTFKKQAAGLGLEQRVRFTGWISMEESAALLKNADAVVLPSRAENMPLSVLEGMAYGLPVIASALGAVPEMLGEGACGLLVPAGEIPPLTAALEKLLTQPLLQKSLGDAGRARFLKQYSMDSYIPALLDAWSMAEKSTYSHST
jgi:glycosyltransferase involved in cell wall biosynthesis